MYYWINKRHFHPPGHGRYLLVVISFYIWCPHMCSKTYVYPESKNTLKTWDKTHYSHGALWVTEFGRYWWPLVLMIVSFHTYIIMNLLDLYLTHQAQRSYVVISFDDGICLPQLIN